MSRPMCVACQHFEPGAPMLPTLPEVGRGAVPVVVAGVCRARPPIGNLCWPKVRPSDFCGEHPALQGSLAHPSAAQEPRRQPRKDAKPAQPSTPPSLPLS